MKDNKKKIYFHNFKYKNESAFTKEETYNQNFMFQKTKLQKKIKQKIIDKPIRGPQELPFMGTISLENQKPRRGRKPKTSSIYNLIHKNYGIDLSSDLLKPSETQIVDKIKQSSFLSDEPLNLCIRENLKASKDIVSPKFNKRLENATQKKKKCLTSPVARKDSNKNEVSICKFKLSNGNLQEKKHEKFSVANGNFNYGYSRSSVLKRQTSDESNVSLDSDAKKFSKILVRDDIHDVHKDIEKRGGFLIQTQESTSSQCGFYKFRHFRTISRYLFRNWKNYLPADSKVEKKLPFIN